MFTHGFVFLLQKASYHIHTLYILCIYMYMYMKNHCHGGARQAAISGQRCFELVSSHQQRIRITCVAHYPTLCTHGEPESLWFCDIRIHIHIHVHDTHDSFVEFSWEGLSCEHTSGKRVLHVHQTLTQTTHYSKASVCPSGQLPLLVPLTTFLLRDRCNAL